MDRIPRLLHRSLHLLPLAASDCVSKDLVLARVAEFLCCYTNTAFDVVALAGEVGVVEGLHCSG